MPKHHDQFDDQGVHPQLPLTHTDYDLGKAQRGEFSELSAEQYLSYVRDQAGRLPVIIKADNVDVSQYTGKQTKYMPDISSIQTCADEHLPSKYWEQSVLENFKNLRQTVQSIKSSTEVIPRNVVVPAMKDERSWFTICSNRDEEFIDDPVSNFSGDVDDSDDEEDDDNDDDSDDVEAYFDRKICSLNEQNHEQIHDGEEKSTKPIDQGEFLKEDTTRLLLEQRRIELEEAERLKEETVQMHKDVNDEKARLLSESKSIEEIHVILKEKFGEAAIAAFFATNESNAILASEFFQSPTVRWTEPMKPSLPLTLQFDQVLVQKLLYYNITWIESQAIISESRSQWIYALLVMLEQPVYQDTVALLRQLYRKCCNMRSMLHNKKDINGSADEDIEKQLASMNLLIVLTGVYFGQGEEYRSE